MTPEVVVRKFFELAATADTAGISNLLDSNVVWFGTRGGLDASLVSHGPEAFLAYLHEIEQAWEQFDVEAEEAVVAFLRETARGRGALDLQNETAVVIKVPAGQDRRGEGLPRSRRGARSRRPRPVVAAAQASNHAARSFRAMRHGGAGWRSP